MGVVGTKIYTYDCLNTLIREGIDVDYLVTLTPEQAEKYAVAGYHDLCPFAEEYGITVYHPVEYSLGTQGDITSVVEMDVDLLLVAGWSRLVPGDILESISIGAIGAHGSPEGLPKGRGRAVLNWALIEGAEEFELATFFLDPDVDSGNIIESKTFDVNEFDTASSLRYKTWIVYTRTVLDNFDDIVSGDVEATPQPSKSATYYPKRKPQDGGIDWHRTTAEIHRFVRALTHPYPGAFTFYRDKKVFIWSARPFDSQLELATEMPGTILKVFCDGDILAETGDSTILIEEYEGVTAEELTIGDTFESVAHEETLREIRKRYPDFVDEEQKEI